jgi:SET domain-containing protein
MAIKDIQKGEEIVVNYGYAEQCHGPPWFRELRKKYKKMLKQKSKIENVKNNKRKRNASVSSTKP